MTKERLKRQGTEPRPIAQKEVEQRVYAFARRYNLSGKVVARGLATQCFLVSEETLPAIIHERHRILWEVLEIPPEYIEQLLKETDDDLKTHGAVGYFNMGVQNERFAFVTSTQHLDHEINHSLAARSNKDRGAFWAPLLRLNPIPLDELVNEILELGVLHPDMDIVQIHDNVFHYKKGFRIPVRTEVLNFLGAVSLTRGENGAGFTLEDLANHFYNDPSKSANKRRGNLVRDIRSRVKVRDTEHTIDVLLFRASFPGAFLCRQEDIENYE